MHPSASFGGWSGGINANAADKTKEVAFAFLSYVSASAAKVAVYFLLIFWALVVLGPLYWVTSPAGYWWVRSRARVPFQNIWGFVEAFVWVGMILGLTVLFRRFLAHGRRVLSALEGNVYGVYLVHWFIVVAIQAAILALAATATGKFLIVTVLATIASFALTAALRAIPGVSRVV